MIPRVRRRHDRKPSRTHEIPPDRRDVRVDGIAAPIGARAFDVLAHLDAHADRVVGKQKLRDRVWGGAAVEEGNLSAQIARCARFWVRAPS
jgi:DNA-binding winged helix-turn-helix (wHTH) protein